MSSIALPGALKQVPHRALITGCTMIATLMQALDNTIANVVLPHMQGTLSASRDQISWVLTSYVIATAVMTAPVGWLSARFGRKHFFMFCLTGFTIASMLCGMAQSLEEMVLFRLLQGFCGASLIPLSQAIMLDLYPLEKRGSAMAIWGIGVMVGPILGPTLGGYLTDLYDWRWVFFINVPFGILAVTGLGLFLHEKNSDRTLKFDWTGFAFLSIALVSMQLMFDRGVDKDWFQSSEIITEAVIAGLGFYLFIVHMFTAQRPFIPLQLFEDVSFVSALGVMFALGLILLGSMALLPPYLENLSGYTVQQTGLLMTPRGFGTMFSMLLVPQLTKRFSPRYIAMAGALMMAWSMWDMSSWTPAIDIQRLIFVSAVQGIGLGFIFMTVQIIAFATLAPHLRTDGTAIYALARSIGMAIGVSITTVALSNSVQTVHSELAAHVTPFNRALGVNAPAMFWSPNIPFGIQNINGEINHQALIISYSNDFLLMFYVALTIIPLLFLIRQPKKGAPAPSAAELAAD